MMLSFPFPYDSDPIVKGDYANTEVIFSINLQNFLDAGAPPGSGPPGPGDLIPQLPVEDLLDDLGLGHGPQGGPGGLHDEGPPPPALDLRGLMSGGAA
jgi:hypothetical protein